MITSLLMHLIIFSLSILQKSCQRICRHLEKRQFALSSLMEIPSQYKATLELDLLGRRRGKSPDRIPLPPPLGNYGEPSFPSKRSRSSSFQPSSPYHRHTSPVDTAPPASAAWDNQVCPICLNNPKDMAFGCGHQTCCDCGECLTSCPICRSDIHMRISSIKNRRLSIF